MLSYQILAKYTDYTFVASCKHEGGNEKGNYLKHSTKKTQAVARSCGHFFSKKTIS